MSSALLEKQRRRKRRHTRVRGKVSGTAERPRLSVHRSNRGVFGQLIDDAKGHTLVAVSWTEQDFRPLSSKERAAKAGEALAKRAREAGIESCVFDRGPYKYHGRVKAFADGARSGGLTF